MRVVICGGHHSSALVVAEKLRERGHRVFWFGHKYSMIGDENPSAEFLEVSQKGIPFVVIRAGKWQPRHHFWQNFFRIPLGFWESIKKLLEVRPDLVVSFGGYIALPVAYSAAFLGILVFTHEQTIVVGLANKLIAKIARKVFITFENSAKYFSGEKVILTGLPLRDCLFEKGQKLFGNSKKTIYITGGKQGSHVINEAVFQILPELLKKFNVLHQCGSSTLFGDFERALKIKRDLGIRGKNYRPKEYFFEEEIGSVFSSADLVISRAGAHIIYELLVLRKPAILIPIPWSSRDEQLKNAQMLQSLGLAEILSQKDLETGMLEKTINDFVKTLPQRNKLTSFPKTRREATDLIVKEIEKIGGIPHGHH